MVTTLTLIITSLTLKLRWSASTFSLVLTLGFIASPHTTTNLFSSSVLSQWLVVLTIYLWCLMTSPPSPHHHAGVSSILTLLIMCLVCLFVVDSVLLFYALFEASLIPMMLIILGWGPQPERVAATLYMVFYTITGSLPFLLVVLKDPNTYFTTLQPSTPPTLSLIIAAPFLIKTPIFMLHLWLPKAHVEAPVYGSMVLAGVLLKIGTFGIWRVTPWMIHQPFLMTLVTTGGVICTFITLTQTDIKALIAYSSVVHMALATTIALLSVSSGLGPVLMLLLAHGVCSSGLFYMATCVYQLYNTRSLLVVQGVLAFAPAITFLWVVAILMNMSTPPSLSLLSEVLMGANVISLTWYYVALLAVLVLMSLVYSIQLFSVMSQGLLHEFSSQGLCLAFYFTGSAHSIWWAGSPLLFGVLE